MATQDDEPVAVVCVPGAWMGGWIWDDTVQRLRGLGHRASTLTLSGLAPATPAIEAAAVTLDDHVAQVVDVVRGAAARSVVLVGHSYSGMVVGQVADRMPDVIRRSVHVGTFLPRHGEALLDAFGTDDATRDAEKQQVRDDGMLWAPPPAVALDGEPDLTASQRRWLSSQLVAHPGHTVLDPATMSRPITEQPVAYIASAPGDADPRGDLPQEFDGGTPPGWTLRTIRGGHWPMLTNLDELIAHIDAAIAG